MLVLLPEQRIEVNIKSSVNILKVLNKTVQTNYFPSAPHVCAVLYMHVIDWSKCRGSPSGINKVLLLLLLQSHFM